MSKKEKKKLQSNHSKVNKIKKTENKPETMPNLKLKGL